jgi:hypothetical protein
MTPALRTAAACTAALVVRPGAASAPRATTPEDITRIAYVGSATISHRVDRVAFVGPREPIHRVELLNIMTDWFNRYRKGM